MNRRLDDSVHFESQFPNTENFHFLCSCADQTPTGEATDDGLHRETTLAHHSVYTSADTKIYDFGYCEAKKNV